MSTRSLPEADKEGWSVEISLDVETVRSVCPKCKILLVEANEPTDVDLAEGVDEAVKLGATEVSNSYGGSEEAGGKAAYQTVQRDGWRLQHPVRRSLVAAERAGLDEYPLRV